MTGDKICQVQVCPWPRSLTITKTLQSHGWREKHKIQNTFTGLSEISGMIIGETRNAFILEYFEYG